MHLLSIQSHSGASKTINLKWPIIVGVVILFGAIAVSITFIYIPNKDKPGIATVYYYNDIVLAHNIIIDPHNIVILDVIIASLSHSPVSLSCA